MLNFTSFPRRKFQQFNKEFMEFDSIDRFSEGNFDESISFREVLEKNLKHLKWYIFSILIFGVLAFLKLYYEVPLYNTSAQILIKEKQKGNSIADLSSFEDLGIFGKDRSSLENEIYILSSRRLISQVVKELKLNVQYFIESEPYDIEQYPDTPIVISLINEKDTLNDVKSDFDDGPIYNIYSSFTVSIISKDKFEYFDSEGVSKGIKRFDQIFKNEFGDIKISLNKNHIKSLIGKNVVVAITPLEITVDIYKNSIVVEPVNEDSDVLDISLNGATPEKSILIINNLIEQYNADAVLDKGRIYNKTSEFLNDRINFLTSQLTAIEMSAEQFKTKKGLVDVQSEPVIFLESSSVNERELIEANTQLQLVDYMIAELDKSNSGLLPANIGLSDPSIINLIGEYNNLILQRSRILKSSTTKNPLIISIDSQLSVLKNNLHSSLNTIKSSIQIQLNSLNRQSGRINSRIASAPKNERLYKDIIRQQETKNALYLFLLQKREESEISKSVTVENAKIIDSAYSSGRPVSPNKKMIYAAAILLGLIIPFTIIYIVDFLDTKIHDENDIRSLRLPYLGDVPLSSSKEDLYISDIDDSNIAESFRYLRTNINFMLDSKDMGKTIFVTSTQSHEGKTFIAINLASSLAISGKKTLLIGMDLRAPKFNKYLGLSARNGVANFIKDNGLPIEDITERNTNFKNLDIICSGDIPPNPVELLMSKRVKELFNEVKEKYEYVIVDTAPVGMVTDTMQISNFADLTIFVIKANFLDKRMLHIPDKLHKENKLPNMAILINGSDHSKGAYGYGYGYGYGKKEKRPWYKKVLQKAAL